MQFNQPRLARASVILCVLLALATACASLASVAWLFELFVHFRPQYAVAGLVLAVALWSLRRRSVAVLALVLAGLNATPVVSLMLAPSPTPREAGSAAPLRVVSINVFGRNRQHARVLDYLRSQQADVVIVLEVTPAWAQALAALRDEYTYSWVVPTGERTGIAMLARKPPVRVREVDLAGTGEPSLLLTVATPGGDARELTILGTHLYWPLGPYVAEVRNRQMAGIARVAREHSGPLAIIGDLNVTSFSPHFKEMLSVGGLRSCAQGQGLEPTWPARMPLLWMQIDHCLVTADVNSLSFAVGGYEGSDHYPIVMQLAPAMQLMPAAGPR